MSPEDKIRTLRIALDLAEEWLSCIEPHIQDAPPFKRDRQKIREAMSVTHPVDWRVGRTISGDVM